MQRILSSKQSKPFNLITALQERQFWLPRANISPSIWPSRLINQYLDTSTEYYFKDLLGHYGCVNSIEFSPDGKMLASGGDDKRVLLWDVWQSIDDSHYTPRVMKGEHSASIFCISFDNQQARLFTGGSDEMVIVHNIETGEIIDAVIHLDDVYGLSVDPSNNNIFASASNDVYLWDLRSVLTNSVKLATGSGVFHAVMHSPQNDNILVTANSKDGVELYDLRRPRQSLFKFYSSTMIKSQSAMSVRFNKSGDLILAIRREQSPVLYNIRSPYPVAEFLSETYYNSCTIKNCAFVGQDDQFVATGSDNFKVYIWKIPHDVRDNPHSESPLNPLKNNYIHQVESAQHVLSGHRSIVNQVVFNYSNGIIASSGIEKVIKFWSPLIQFNENQKVDTNESKMNRNFYNHEDYLGFLSNERMQPVDDRQNTVVEDRRMLAYFDSMILQDLESQNCSTSSDDDEFEIEIGREKMHDSDEDKVPSGVSLSEIETDSEDDFFLVQQTFVFNSKINYNDFKHNDYLKLVSAKRVYIRYIIRVVDDFLSAARKENLTSLRNLQNERPETSSQRSQSLSSEGRPYFSFRNPSSSSSVQDMFTLNDKLKAKKQKNLLYRITRFVDSLLKRFAAGSIFRKVETKSYQYDEIDPDISRDNFQKQIKAMSRIKVKKLCDKQLYRLFQKLLKKAIELKKDMLEFKECLDRSKPYHPTILNFLMNAFDFSDSDSLSLSHLGSNEDLDFMVENNFDTDQSSDSDHGVLSFSSSSSTSSSDSSNEECLTLEQPTKKSSIQTSSEIVSSKDFGSGSIDSSLREQPSTSSTLTGSNNQTQNDKTSSSSSSEKIPFKKIDRKNKNYKTNSKNASQSKNKKKRAD